MSLKRQKSIINDDNAVDTSCGIGSWRPAWLQFFASPLFFVINISAVGIIQAMTAPLYGSAMTTFEKRFGFDSRISGIILVADNFAEILLNPIVGYIAIRYNRARIVAIGEVIIAFSCFFAATPFFIYGPATHMLEDAYSPFSKSNTTNFEMCNFKDKTEFDCRKNASVTVWPAVIILFLGSFIRGIGNTCYWIVAVPAMDDSLPKSKSPVYISALQCARLVGPASGFLLSSYSLSWYENPLITPSFSRSDPRFIGAWWLSFIVVGILLLLVALPMFAFPSEIKGSSVRLVDVRKKLKENGGSLGALKRFVKNPILMIYMFGNIFRFFGMNGFYTFKSKFVESMYRISSSNASFITGTTAFAPLAIGIITGGFIITYFKPKPRTVLMLVFAFELTFPLAISSGFFLGCEKINIDGHKSESGVFSLDSSCNSGCDCSTNVYNPICGSDKKTTYFSSCHGGCTQFNRASMTFESCSCFSGVATKGYCQSEDSTCTGIIPYLGSIIFGGVISQMANTPNALIALRSVDPMDKSFSLGVASTMANIFAFLPAPLVFGYIVESACLVWESKCGSTGNCWLYDNAKLRKYYHSAAVIFMLLGSACDFAMIFFADRMENFAEDDDDVDDEEKGEKSNKIDN